MSLVVLARLLKSRLGTPHGFLAPRPGLLAGLVRIALVLLVLLVPLILLLPLVLLGCAKPNLDSTGGTNAFGWTYLEAGTGSANLPQRACRSCHAPEDRFNPETWAFLARRQKLSYSEWAAQLSLETRCGVCHVTPHPANLPSASWAEAIPRMNEIRTTRGLPKLEGLELQDLLHLYLTHSVDHLPPLPPDGSAGDSPVRFQPARLSGLPGERAILGRIELFDLDQNGAKDILVCDTDQSRLTWLRQQDGAWLEETLARLPCPTTVRVLTNTAPDGAKSFDLVVACQERNVPTDDPIGSVVYLDRSTPGEVRARTLLEKVSRVSDVAPADLDGEGSLDLLVAAFGFLLEGEIGWIQSAASAQPTYRRIVRRTGAVRAAPADLDGDGRIDFVALFAQEHEQISAFLNRGGGAFEERVLFKARTPAYGSSSLELADLDQDGDPDILWTNGDNLDLPTTRPRPYHGVQWLENRGELKFVWHDLQRLYGAYSAQAGDLDRDGRLDIVVTSMFNDWADPARASVLWLENRGDRYVPHRLAHDPIHLIACAVDDLNGDGWPEVVAAGMHRFPPHDRPGRISIWINQGRVGQSSRLSPLSVPPNELRGTPK